MTSSKWLLVEEDFELGCETFSNGARDPHSQVEYANTMRPCGSCKGKFGWVRPFNAVTRHLKVERCEFSKSLEN